MRDSTIFYRSFYEAIKDLPSDVQAQVYNAIFEYSLNFVEIELSGLSKTIFTLIKPQIEANIKRYKSGMIPKVKQDVSESEAKVKRNRSESEANKNDNVNDNKNVNKNNNIEERKLKFAQSLNPFLELYGEKTIKDFIGYWTEPNKSNTKFRQELEKTWDLSRRLTTWVGNDFNKSKKDISNKPALVR